MYVLISISSAVKLIAYYDPFFSDVHSLVISLIQKYAITTKEDNAGIRTSVVLLAESIVRATLHGQQEKFKDSSKKVYFEDEKGETVCKIGWEMVSGLHIMLLKSMFVELEVLKSDAKEVRTFFLLYINI